MKKTLLSILAGLMVIGSASAVPTPEDRRALCEKHPDKYVWVEKDEFCAPINPCESDNKEIRDAYCVNFVPLAEEKVFLAVYDRYITQVLHTNPASSVSYEGEGGIKYYAYKLADGGYVVFRADSISFDSTTNIKYVLEAVCSMYNPEDMYDGVVTPAGLVEKLNSDMFACPLVSVDACDEITRFVSSLDIGKIEGGWDATTNRYVWKIK